MKVFICMLTTLLFAVDTGNTLKYMIKQLHAREPKSVKTVVLLHKVCSQCFTLAYTHKRVYNRLKLRLDIFMMLLTRMRYPNALLQSWICKSFKANI
jgi:hypoxanthine phosphoribosyltransferase